MKRNNSSNRDKAIRTIGVLLTFATFGAAAFAQTPVAPAKPVEAKTSDAKPAEPTSVQIFQFKSVPGQRELNDVQTLLRNMLPHSRLYAVPTSNAIVIQATAEDLQLAQTLMAAFDQQKQIYRLTYTINESDSGKRIGSQHFTLVVVSGARTDLKQGSKVPLAIAPGAQKEDVTYEDVGLEIEADMDGYSNGVRLHTRVAQSSIAEEKAGVSVGTGNPVIRQTALEGTSILEDGKPLILGSIDVPGSTRHQDIEVVADLIK